MNASYSRLRLEDLLRVNVLAAVSNFARLSSALATPARAHFTDFQANFDADLRALGLYSAALWRRVQAWGRLLPQSAFQFAVLFLLKARLRGPVFAPEAFFFVVVLKRLCAALLGFPQGRALDSAGLARRLFEREPLTRETLSIYARGPAPRAAPAPVPRTRRSECLPALHSFLRGLAGPDQKELAQVLDFTVFFVAERFAAQFLGADCAPPAPRQAAFVDLLFALDFHDFLEKHKAALIDRLRAPRTGPR